MSTRCSKVYEKDEKTGEVVHLYEDLEDEANCVFLELEGFSFQSCVEFAPSGRPSIHIQVEIPCRFATALGLIRTEADGAGDQGEMPVIMRRNLRHERDELTGQEVHLYESQAGGTHDVVLRLAGFTFEASALSAPSDRPHTLIMLRIPYRFARVLGLMRQENAIKD